MDKLIQFGESPDYYRFVTADQVSITPTFGDTVPSVSRLVGVDGSFINEGRSRPRSASGNVQAFFWLTADTASAMQTKRAEYHKMLGWGLARLFKENQDGVTMWTWAVVNNLQDNQSVQERPHRLQRVQVNFQCSKSRWFCKPGDALSTAGVYTEGATRSASNSVANGSTVSVTNNGTAPAGLKITWTAPGGVTITNPAIERRDGGGTAIEKVTYTAVLSPTDTAEIDARNHQLSENLTVSPSYGKLTVLTADWLTIPPGTTTLYISGTFSGGNGTLDLDWWDTYY